MSHDVRSLASDASKNQKQVRLKFCKPLWRYRHALNHDVFLSMEFDKIEAAKRRKHLVLAANIVLQNVALHMNGFVSKLVRAEKFTLERMQRMQQRDSEGRRRPQP